MQRRSFLKFLGVSPAVLALSSQQAAASACVNTDIPLPLALNRNGEDYDFRIEGDGHANPIYDASNTRYEIGNISPSHLLSIE
jgi:hypothetical protein